MQPIETAPRDETEILAYHKIHGWMQARFCPGEWHEHHEYGRQYDGPVWLFGDDILQEEVEEEINEKSIIFHDGQVTHWMPLPEKP